MHKKMKVFELSADNKLIAALHFSVASMFCKDIFNFDSTDHRGIFHFTSVHFHRCSDMSRSLHDRALACICGWHNGLYSFMIFGTTYSDFHDRTMSVFNVVITGSVDREHLILYLLNRPSPLHTEIFTDSLSPFIILCSEYDKVSFLCYFI